jgi:DNA-binding transcriptional LysR family regulator
VRDTLLRLQTAIAPNVFDPATASTIFVLTMADATAAELMPPLVELITQRAPDVSLRVVPLTTRDPRRLLDEGHADLAIGNFPAVMADLTARAQSGENVPFLHHRLFQGDYVCAMRKGHSLAKGQLTLDRYCAARHMLVSFSGRAYGFIDEALGALDRSRRVVLTVNQFFTAGKIVAHSDLLTVLPRHFVNVTGFADQLVLRELPFTPPTIQVDALWHQRKDASSAHAWLRTRVAELAAKAFDA